MDEENKKKTYLFAVHIVESSSTLFNITHKW